MIYPLVSCLCPTANRREFIPTSLDLFLNQDYPNLELIILDDGEDLVKDLIPHDPRIKYYYEPPRKNHGQKMNRCMELSQGEYVIVWDDDDWYASNRISKHIQPMIDNPEIWLTGTSRLYYQVYGEEKAYRYQNWTIQPWIGAFSMRKSLWDEGRKFESIPAGADVKMLNSIPLKHWNDLNDLSLMVATIHSDNASKKNLPSMSFIETSYEEIKKVKGIT